MYNPLASKRRKNTKVTFEVNKYKIIRGIMDKLKECCKANR